MKLRRLRWVRLVACMIQDRNAVRYVACMIQDRNAVRVVVRKPE